ncbi:hypothetical protein M5U04_20215 [Xenorhabdus sp. XENO-1]|uniref:hypothetical protein n=1 Tax=Xenorhabdus bovienii TaxID=40576 RepID=UPI0020CA3A70|nr:hypothetical protein [Xenorhabdus bovienii]MCP9270331.1 hypothetical protein [Xenorhabdus bovienii subsp. africana]
MLPTHTQQFDAYDPDSDWAGVTGLRLSCSDSRPVLYRNGLHMLQVVVSFKPKGSHGQDVKIKPETVLKAVSLIDFYYPITIIPKGVPPTPPPVADEASPLIIKSGPFYSTEHGVFYTGNGNDKVIYDAEGTVYVPLYFGYGPDGLDVKSITLGCRFDFPNYPAKENSASSSELTDSSPMISFKDKYTYDEDEIHMETDTDTNVLSNGWKECTGTTAYFNFNTKKGDKQGYQKAAYVTRIKVKQNVKMGNNSDPWFNYKQTGQGLALWTMTDSNVDIVPNGLFQSKVYDLDYKGWILQFTTKNRRKEGVSIIYVTGLSNGHNFDYWEWGVCLAEFIMYDSYGNYCGVSLKPDEGAPNHMFYISKKDI